MNGKYQSEAGSDFPSPECVKGIKTIKGMFSGFNEHYSALYKMPLLENNIVAALAARFVSLGPEEKRDFFSYLEGIEIVLRMHQGSGNGKYRQLVDSWRDGLLKKYGGDIDEG